MAIRSSRFIDEDVNLLVTQSSLNIEDIIAENLSKISEYLEEEKSASSSFGDAWSQATDLYSSRIKENLNANDTKKIDEQLAKELPDSLKSTPCYLPIAIVVCTQDPSDFFDEYNKAVRAMFASNDWDSFSFKGLFLLLNLAAKLLPSRPGKQMGKFVFRGLNTEQEFTTGYEFSLGYTAPFTVKRFMALGTKPPKADNGEEDEADNDPEESFVQVGLSKTLLKVQFSPTLQGLGVKHLSGHSEEEKEVLVLPQQRFKVVEVNKNRKKGFSVVVVEPVVA